MSTYIREASQHGSKLELVTSTTTTSADVTTITYGSASTPHYYYSLASSYCWYQYIKVADPAATSVLSSLP